MNDGKKISPGSSAADAAPITGLEISTSSSSILTFLTKNGIEVDEALVSELPESLLTKHETASRTMALLDELRDDDEFRYGAKFAAICPEFEEEELVSDLHRLRSVVRIFVKNILLTTIIVPVQEIKPEGSPNEEEKNDIDSLYDDIDGLIERWSMHFDEILTRSITYLGELGKEFHNPVLFSAGDEDEFGDWEDDFLDTGEWHEEPTANTRDKIPKHHLTLVYDILLAFDSWVHNLSERISLEELGKSKEQIDRLLTFAGMIKSTEWEIFERFPYYADTNIIQLADDLIYTLNGLADKMKHSVEKESPKAKMRTKKQARKKSNTPRKEIRGKFLGDKKKQPGHTDDTDGKEKGDGEADQSHSS